MLLLQFTAAGEVDDNMEWHVAMNPVEGDRTLCGIAHEGLGKAEYGVDTNTTKHGRTITCTHCVSFIQLCRTL